MEKLTPAAVMLEASRRMYPESVFVIVAAHEDGSLDVTSNGADVETIVDILTEATNNIKENGVEKKPSPRNLN
jgi:hypothetical protein